MLRWPKTRRSRYERLREARKWGGERGGKQSGWWSGGWTGRKGEGGSELWKRGRLQWLASIDLPCDAILPPYATGVDHPSATPLSPLAAAARRGHPPRGRGRHFEKWFRKSSWLALAFFSGLDPARPTSLSLSLFRARSFALEGPREEKADARQKKKERKNYRGKRRGNKWALVLVGVCVSWLLSLKWWDFRDTRALAVTKRTSVFYRIVYSQIAGLIITAFIYIYMCVFEIIVF